MATRVVPIPVGEIVNVHVEGNLENGTDYSVQNGGNNVVFVGEYESEPDSFNGHPIKAGRDFHVKADDDQQLYAQTSSAGRSNLVITEAN